MMFKSFGGIIAIREVGESSLGTCVVVHKCLAIPYALVPFFNCLPGGLDACVCLCVARLQIESLLLVQMSVLIRCTWC